MYHKRTLENRWLEISKQFPVLLLTGPRQVGKTTFLKHIAEKSRTYVSFDDPDARLLANEDPAMFFRRYRPPVLIDEIQYAPNILQYIKMRVDENRQPGLFWLTGSQQFLMMKGISESLAGRIGIMNLLGFSSTERYDLDIETAPFIPSLAQLEERQQSRRYPLENIYSDIWRGCFPELIAGNITDWDIFYSSYLRTYLERDVRDLTKVGDEGTFLRFLKACAARTGQMLNLSDLARDVDVTVKTAKDWLSILEASFQVYLLQPYHTNLTKRLVKTPKLYVLDTGLCCYLTQWTNPEALAAGAMAGSILETYIFTEILKNWWHQAKTPEIFYYRDKDKVEIDFILTQNQQFYPVEVKKSASPKKDWINSFKKLNRLGPIASGGVICLGNELLPLGEHYYSIPANLL
jgi:predicted AAA+ superfamily ATPase